MQTSLKWEIQSDFDSLLIVIGLVSNNGTVPETLVEVIKLAHGLPFKKEVSPASRLALIQKSPASRLAVDLKVSCQPATITYQITYFIDIVFLSVCFFKKL